jgi:hypothetical protein
VEDKKKKIEQFTAANSPVRLIEPDQAWAAMKQQLDAQWPAPSNTPRSFRFTRFFGGMGVVALAVVASLVLLRENNTKKTVQPYVETKPALPEAQQQEPPTHASPVNGEAATGGQAATATETTIAPFNNSDSMGGPTAPGVANSRPPLAGRYDKITHTPGNERKNTNTSTATGHGKETNETTDRTRQERQEPAVVNHDRQPLTTTDKTGERSRKQFPASVVNAGKKAGTYNKAGKNNTIQPVNSQPEQEQTPDEQPASSMVTTVPFKPVIDVAGLVAPLPVDSAGGKNNAATGQKNKKGKHHTIFVTAGLQWAAILPAQNNIYYSTGPGGRNQAYRHLLPGVVLSLQKNRHRVGINLYPFIQSQLQDVAYSSSKDTMGRLSETYSLVKLFGYGAGINYAFNLHRHWWVGAGIQGNWWNKGLIHHQYTISSAAPNDSLLLLRKGDSAWKNFARAQYKADFEIWYDRKQWALGLQGSLPLIKPVKNVGAVPRQPTTIALLLRWKLWNSGRR